MFGVVPKTMWERKLKPDDRNRVLMALRCLLLRVDGRTILIDTGLTPAAVEDPVAYYERPDVFAVSTLEQEQSVAEQLDVSAHARQLRTQLGGDGRHAGH